MRLWEAQGPADAPREAEVRIRREDGAYREYVARLAPVPAPDGAEHARVAVLTPSHELARLSGIRALYSVPLVTLRSEVVGVLVTGFGEQHAPAPRERLLVELFARQAADVLDRARLLDAEQRAHAAAEARAAELAAGIETITDGVDPPAPDRSLPLRNAPA